MNWLKIILENYVAILTIVLLGCKLFMYIRQLAKEKNWNRLVELVMRYMKEAEVKLIDGADRREWVIAMVKASAESINFDIDVDIVGQLIDSMCDMSKVVNSAIAEKAGE